MEKWVESLSTEIGPNPACKSGHSCLTTGMCLDNPMCKAVLGIGRSAGFVQPTPSAGQCGFCEPSFGGHVCFCPTRWALDRRERRPSAL